MSPVSIANRIAAFALLLTLAPAAYAGAVCAGWASSAAERMACCQRANGGCAALSPDDCCASQEQRQNQESGTIVVIIPVSTPFVLAPVASKRVDTIDRDPRALVPLPATHLLNSVFLI